MTILMRVNKAAGRELDYSFDHGRHTEKIGRTILAGNSVSMLATSYSMLHLIYCTVKTNNTVMLHLIQCYILFNATSQFITNVCLFNATSHIPVIQ